MSENTPGLPPSNNALSGFNWDEYTKGDSSETIAPVRSGALPRVNDPAPAVITSPQETSGYELDDDTFEVESDDVEGPILPTAVTDVDIEAIESVEDSLNINELLEVMLDMKGSDLHLSVNSYPMTRVRGDMTPLPGYPKLTGSQIEKGINGIMTQSQRNVFEENWELDFAHNLVGKSRFRVNVMKQRRNVSVVMRAIPFEILPIEALNLPDILNQFAALPRGLVLVTGPTGSGKSTTLAAIIDKANRTRAGHIVTIEDPIEFVHEHKKSVVNQREVGEDTKSFAAALKHVLRQDPDIILVGEMRDLETISVALTAAETGHLVFGTLHTQSAAETISRIIDVFPEGAKSQVRTQLAASIQGVVCQTLLKTTDGKGRAAGVEIMIGTSAIRNLIRDDKTFQIESALQAGKKDGMQTMDTHLAELVAEGRVNYEDAAEKAKDAKALREALGGEEGLRRIARQRASKNMSLQG